VRLVFLFGTCAGAPGPKPLGIVLGALPTLKGSCSALETKCGCARDGFLTALTQICAQCQKPIESISNGLIRSSWFWRCVGQLQADRADSGFKPCGMSRLPPTQISDLVLLTALILSAR